MHTYTCTPCSQAHKTPTADARGTLQTDQTGLYVHILFTYPIHTPSAPHSHPIYSPFTPHSHPIHTVLQARNPPTGEAKGVLQTDLAGLKAEAQAQSREANGELVGATAGADAAKVLDY